jgi:hypothetical protein
LQGAKVGRHFEVRTVARIALTVAGAEMVFLGVLSIAYGHLFTHMRMFAIFNPEMATMLGIVAVVTGVALLVVARRGLRAKSVAKEQHWDTVSNA